MWKSRSYAKELIAKQLPVRRSSSKTIGALMVGFQPDRAICSKRRQVSKWALRIPSRERIDHVSLPIPRRLRVMCSLRWHLVLSSMAVAFFAAIVTPSDLVAQATQHLVSPDDLQKAAVGASQTRQQNLDALNRFFSSNQAQKALQSAHIDPQQVKNAVAGLSDQELAQFATRAKKAQNDFAAGNMSDRDLLIILVCIAALILIIVAVH